MLFNKPLLKQQGSAETFTGSVAGNVCGKSREPFQIEHPIAKTKFEAIDWNIKHTMWHCGQLGILKRIVGERYDFGLNR